MVPASLARSPCIDRARRSRLGARCRAGVCPNGAELRRRTNELVEHECLRMLRERPETSWELSRGKGRPKRYPITGRFETSDGRALSEALYAGIGIGVRLRSEIDAAVHDGTLEHVLPDWQWASTPVYALMPKGRAKLAARAHSPKRTAKHDTDTRTPRIPLELKSVRPR